MRRWHAWVALVIDQHVEMAGKGSIQYIRAHPQIAAGAGNEEQARAGADALMENLDVTRSNDRHGTPLPVNIESPEVNTAQMRVLPLNSPLRIPCVNLMGTAALSD